MVGSRGRGHGPASLFARRASDGADDCGGGERRARRRQRAHRAFRVCAGAATIERMQTATERLGAGDFRHVHRIAGGDEVSAVARSFNRMADELRPRALALEAADRMRRQLLADVSHELMTPLTAMRGYLETLSMPEVPIDAATRERYLGIINDETHRLERIVGDLLDLARLEGGGATLRRERVSSRALFDRVRARHEKASRCTRLSASSRRSSLAPTTSKAIRIASSRRCKILPRMRCAIRLKAARSGSRRRLRMVQSTCASAIPGRGSRKNTCP